MDVEYKEVDFEKYCKTCKYEKLEGFQSPCNECLENSMNIQTSKPTEWVEKK